MMTMSSQFAGKFAGVTDTSKRLFMGTNGHLRLSVELAFHSRIPAHFVVFDWPAKIAFLIPEQPDRVANPGERSPLWYGAIQQESALLKREFEALFVFGEQVALSEK